MIKIAVCDNEKVYTDLIENYLMKVLEQKSVDYSIDKYTQSLLLLRDIESKEFDVLFLDIDMPVKTGFDIAQYTREISLHTFIIFITSKSELVYDSFEYTPFYYICKTSCEELLNDINHVIDKLLIHFIQDKVIQLTDSTRGICLIKLSDIIYIESEKHYLNYYVINSEIPYKERATFTERESEWKNANFLKIHQRYTVNMNHITTFDSFSGKITLCNNMQLPISRSFRESATEKYIIYKRK